MKTKLEFLIESIEDEERLEAIIRAEDLKYALKEVIGEIDKLAKTYSMSLLGEAIVECQKKCYNIVENLELKYFVNI